MDCQAATDGWHIADYIPSVADFVKIAITIALGSLAAIKITNRVTSRLKARDDYVEKRVDDLVSDIRAVGNACSDYWIKDNGDNAQRLAEAKISAGIRYIEEMRVAISSTLPELTDDNISRQSQAFLREATGGDFGVHNRAADPTIAIRVQYASLRYITAIRKARLNTHNK